MILVGVSHYSTQQILSQQTFGAAYPHDSLEANLPGYVSLQLLLETLHLGGVVLVVVGGEVVNAPCRVSGYAAWGREGRQEKK